MLKSIWIQEHNIKLQKCSLCLRKGCTDHSNKDLIKKVDRSYCELFWLDYLLDELDDWVRIHDLSEVKKKRGIKTENLHGQLSYKFPEYYYIFSHSVRYAHIPKIFCDLDDLNDTFYNLGL